MRGAVASYGPRLRMVPVGRGAQWIQSSHSTGENILAGVLGAHRICVWTSVHPAEEAMQHRKSDRGIAGDFCRHDVVIAPADQLETKKRGSAVGKLRRHAKRQRSRLDGLLMTAPKLPGPTVCRFDQDRTTWVPAL